MAVDEDDLEDLRDPREDVRQVRRLVQRGDDDADAKFGKRAVTDSARRPCWSMQFIGRTGS